MYVLKKNSFKSFAFNSYLQRAYLKIVTRFSFYAKEQQFSTKELKAKR